LSRSGAGDSLAGAAISDGASGQLDRRQPLFLRLESRGKVEGAGYVAVASKLAGEVGKDGGAQSNRRSLFRLLLPRGAIADPVGLGLQELEDLGTLSVAETAIFNQVRDQTTSRAVKDMPEQSAKEP
jgi:hypothetical protein